MVWLEEEWKRLRLIEPNLRDEDFLQQFRPILETFLTRKPHLERCAQSLVDLYELRDCRVLEPASGCDVLPAILRSLGCRAIGLEAEASLAARYCRIKRLPLITSKGWTSPWTADVFDLVVVAAYVTSPESSDWAREVTQSFCESAFYQISNGAELVLFDSRYVEPLRQAARIQSWPIECEGKDGVGLTPTVFFRSSTRSARRKW